MALKRPVDGKFFAVLLLWLAAVAISRWQTAVNWLPPSELLPLWAPALAVVETEGLEPIALGHLAWVSGERVTLRFRELQAGDLVKVKAAADPGPCPVVVELDRSPLTVWVVERHGGEHRFVLPRNASTLSLRQGPRPCAVHLFQVKRQGFLASSGGGLGEAYLLSQVKPRHPPASWAVVLPPAWVALLSAFALGLLSPPPKRGIGLIPAWIPLVAASGQFLVAAGAAALAGSRVLYPRGTLWLVWLWPQVVGVAVAVGRWVAGVEGKLPGAKPPWLVVLARGDRALRRAGSNPLPFRPAWVGAALLALYACWLVVTLPQTPMEWDEVLFAQAVLRFDVAAHAPHPPGYPVYVGLSKAFAWFGAGPVHAPQLASAVGALLALMGVGWVVRGAGFPSFAAVVAGVFAAASPVFAFHANLGLSDMLAAGLAVLALASLLALERDPRASRALLSGLLTALTCGVRPQGFLVLLLPWALVAWRSSRRKELAWFWAVPAALAVSLAIWVPVLVATGPARYLQASEHLATWMNAYEYLSRFPAMEVSRFFQDWLIRPLGGKTLAFSFWAVCLAGGFFLWFSGRGRLVALLASGAGGYLLLAPWTMTAEASVRYSLPAYVFLAPLAAGLLLRASKGFRFGVLLVVAWAVAAFSWTVPVLTLRAAEANPVWAALSWVRKTQPPQVVAVDGGIRPHAAFLLDPAGFEVTAPNDRDSFAGLWVHSPAVARNRRVLFAASWPEPKLGELARRRYLSAAVTRSLETGPATDR